MLLKEKTNNISIKTFWLLPLYLYIYIYIYIIRIYIIYIIYILYKEGRLSVINIVMI